MMGLRSFWISLYMLFIVPIYGQFQTDTIHIREVQVLANRKIEEAGLKITRPDSLQRASMLTTNLSDLLSDYSPVFIKSHGKGSEATASFRGAAANHTQVYWNGMSLNSPMRGLADLSMFPVYFTDGIYLLHGGSSMTKGSGALGGSIHLENSPLWNSKFGLEGMLESGSFNSNKVFFRFHAGRKSFHFSTRLFYEYSENSFPFLNTGVMPKKADTLKNADYNKAGILQEVYLRHGQNSVSAIRLWYQSGDRNLPQLMSYQGSSREEFRLDKQFIAQYDWKKYSPLLNYHFFSGINKSKMNYYRATPAFEFVNEDSGSRENGFLNHLRVFRKFNERIFATVTFDVNYYQVNATDNITGRGIDENRVETSFMLNMHLKPVDCLAFFVLVRSETYDENMVPLIPSAGLEWQIDKTVPVVMRVNGARNYHKPSLNDLYWIPGGNAQLLPEDGYTGEISFSSDFVKNSFGFNNEVTGFISKIENWITWQPASSGAYYWEADNIKNVLSRGIEYQFTTRLRRGSFLFRSGGNYSFTFTSNLNPVHSADESRGKQLVYIPKHKGGIYFSTVWKDYFLKFDLNTIGKRYTKSSNQESYFEQVLNPYTLGKVTAGKQVSLYELLLTMKLTVENVFNQTYQSILWRPMPGRFYSFSAAIKLNNEK